MDQVTMTETHLQSPSFACIYDALFAFVNAILLHWLSNIIFYMLNFLYTFLKR